MEVPTELLVLLSNTQSLDQSLRLKSEEQLKFLEKNEPRKSPHSPRRSLTRQTEFPLLLTTIAVDEFNDRVLRQVPISDIS